MTYFNYDNNGNQTSVYKSVYNGSTVTTSLVTINVYDELNRLTSSTAGDKTAVYTYNPDDLRDSKLFDNKTTKYFYEYDKVVLETDANGNQTARNIYGTNLLMRQADGLTLYYMYNGHGDVTALIDTDGVLRATYYYDAFGNPVDWGTKYYDANGNLTASAVNNPFGYAGYQYDKETGLYYLNARMYDPKIARFLQEDTYLGDEFDPLSLNLYTYCHNEPIMYFDPSGHRWVSYVAYSGKYVGYDDGEKDQGISYGAALTEPNTSPVEYFEINPAKKYTRGITSLTYFSKRYYELQSSINYYNNERKAGRFVHDTIWRQMPMWEKTLAELEIQALSVQTYMFNNRNSLKPSEFDISAKELYGYTKNKKVIPPLVLEQMKESYIGSDSFRRKLIADEEDLIHRENLSNFLESMVGLSVAKSAIDLILDEDFLTGEELSTSDYVFKTIDVVGLGFSAGKIAKGFKGVKYLGYVDEVTDAGRALGHLDDVSDINRIGRVVDDVDSYALRPSTGVGEETSELTTVFRKSDIVGDSPVSLKQLKQALGKRGMSISKKYNIEYVPEILDHRGNKAFASNTQIGDFNVERGVNGRPLIKISDLGLSSMEQGVKSIFHEIDHIKSILRNNIPSSEEVAETYAEKMFNIFVKRGKSNK